MFKMLISCGRRHQDHGKFTASKVRTPCLHLAGSAPKPATVAAAAQPISRPTPANASRPPPASRQHARAAFEPSVAAQRVQPLPAARASCSRGCGWGEYLRGSHQASAVQTDFSQVLCGLCMTNDVRLVATPIRAATIAVSRRSCWPSGRAVHGIRMLTQFEPVSRRLLGMSVTRADTAQSVLCEYVTSSSEQ